MAHPLNIAIAKRTNGIFFTLFLFFRLKASCTAIKADRTMSNEMDSNFRRKKVISDSNVKALSSVHHAWKEKIYRACRINNTANTSFVNRKNEILKITCFLRQLESNGVDLWVKIWRFLLEMLEIEG